MYEWVKKLFEAPFRPGKITMRKYLSYSGAPFSFMGGDYKYANELAMMFDIDMTVKSALGNTRLLQHACCFYTCGGLDMMYEDNNGPYPFPWRKLMDTYSTSNSSVRAIHCIGSASIRDKSSGGYTVTEFYPIYYEKATETYSTLISGSSELIPLTQQGDTLKCEASSETYALKLSANYKLIKEGENRMIDVLPVKVEGIDIGKNQSKPFYLGSRQLSTATSSGSHLRAAIATGNANAFKNIYKPNINIGRFQNSILNTNNEDIIITVLDKLNLTTLLEHLVRANLYQPKLIKAMFEDNEEVRKRIITRRRSFLLSAIDGDADNLVRSICKYYKPLVIQILESPEKYTDEDTKPEILHILNTCGASGGKRRTRKSKSKRFSRANSYRAD
jgi:hypothetical protein